MVNKMARCPKCYMVDKKETQMIIGIEEFICPECGYSYINTK